MKSIFALVSKKAKPTQKVGFFFTHDTLIVINYVTLWRFEFFDLYCIIKCNANMTEKWRNYSQMNSLKIQKSTLRQFLAEKEKILKSDFQILQELNHSEGEFFELEG